MIEKVPCTVGLTHPTRGCCRQIDEAIDQAHARESKRVAPATVDKRPTKRRGTLQKLWTPTPR
ncbi:hypothetical protein JG687_00018597 [Phytophthora cactorum]|uniref:Uncharacterized protein n=1 Tax=Phytophthora cactorum TaxID=29920 RepID=A0A8T1TNK5_9STRA|nr:hypothetical protein GQ600_14651 [Phytophthora cactorum]KAG6943217.1 hypothetical protein JG687_00018597 [Phytophthora cactorum]